MPRRGPTDDELRWFYDRYAERGMPYARQEWDRVHGDPENPLSRSAAYEWITKYKSLEEARLMMDQFTQQLRAYTAIELLKGRGIEEFERPETELKWEVYAPIMRRLIRDQVEYAGALPKVPIELLGAEKLADPIRTELEELTRLVTKEADDTIAAIQPQQRKDAS